MPKPGEGGESWGVGRVVVGATDHPAPEPGTLHINTATGSVSMGTPGGLVPIDNFTRQAISNSGTNALASKTAASGSQFVGSSRFDWQASGTPDGGITFSAADGGVFVRQYVGPVYAAWFGVSAANPDNTAALNAALGAAPVRGEVRLPAGTLVHLGVIDNSVKGAALRGEGQESTRLKCTAELGPNSYAVVLSCKVTGQGEETYTVARDMSFEGPGFYALGQTMTTTGGIKINSACRFENVRSWRYRYGFSPNTLDGHITWIGCNITNNFVGIYFLQDGYDNHIYDSYVDGNTFANVGATWSSSVSIFALRVHMGHAPFGMIQDPEPGGSQLANAFLLNLRLIECRFEQIGNMAIHTPNAGAACSNWSIDGEGFGFSPPLGQANSYAVPVGAQGFAPGRDYAVDVGLMNGENYIAASSDPFVGGTLGGIRIRGLNGGLHYEYSQAYDPMSQKLSIGGSPELFKASGTRMRGRVVMNAGQSSLGIRTRALFPAVSAFVNIGSHSDPGGRVWVDGVGNAGDTGEVVFTINRDPAQTANPAVFTWALA